MIRLWLKEIKAVGLKDWYWFVFILRRDEFSKKLNPSYYYKKWGQSAYQLHLMRDREKAHNIDLIFMEIHNG